MSNSIRIKTKPNGGDKYLKVNLEQEFDFIEILSLKLTQEDVYRNFCSDYGVVVGRVIINSGLGVPNAKVSIFIPIDDVDKQDPTIKGLYPYELVTDKNGDGIKYNLLPSSNDIDNECFTPVGTFPNKREVLDNETMLNLYCKYYKFTTTTNHAGDFMIFGVPIGTYTLHVDADISDIGILSQRPYDLTRQGTPSKLFESPTKFKGGTNLDKLVQIKTANVGINVQPFWGDMDNCQIGITRTDIDLNYSITPSAIFMGSIFGDQEKNSINKRCRPRQKIGELCEQVPGPGFINMIRKNLDGTIEDYDIDGGNLIDEDGTWSYQIPMNLDYMVTDEEGNLIPSDDENIGIPTRTSVRFKIGMYETGGEGRLRTRAQYLVPHNPKKTLEIDYDFGENTKDKSFKDLYWNKIYTVSNFISRFQTNRNSKNRNMIGIKSVDSCSGDKTPFPYNRVNTNSNPTFFIICLIIKIIAFLIYVMNIFIIPLINVVVKLINFVVGNIVLMINKLIDLICLLVDLIPTAPSCGLDRIPFTKVPYIGCLAVPCPTSEDPKYYAPGCIDGGLDSGESFSAATPNPTYYCNDGGTTNHQCSITEYSVGLDDCMAFEMAKSLDLFRFDFYNDWINGSLYGFLLKYKKKRKGREKFCEYDCQDFVSDSNYSGVDGNENGPDNNCHNNFLVDTCYSDIDSINCQFESYNSGIIREGLIKKYNNEFYYAASTHNKDFNLYATDIVSLGSILKNDWQGIAKIQPFLTQTTYKLPPDTQELEDDDNDATVLSCGMVDIDGDTRGLFFSVNCLGLHVNRDQTLNIRHLCELGVDIDESTEDIGSNTIKPADCNIGSDDISNFNKELRNVFIGLNGFNSVVTNSSFNIGNVSFYNFTETNPTINDPDYISFRGYGPSAFSDYRQSTNSLYMYFGLLPGKTALDKMNQKFFSNCKTLPKNNIIIEATTTAASAITSTGSITFSFIGGFPEYNYTVTGPNSFSTLLSVTTSVLVNNELTNTTTITGLFVGVYTITGTDSLGNSVARVISVTGPIPLYCSANVSQNVTGAGLNDGKILVSSIGGGVTPYNLLLSDGLGNSTSIQLLDSVQNYYLTGLTTSTTNGYTLSISDSSVPPETCITTGLTITSPSSINLAVTPTDVTCYNGNDGSLNISVNGGFGPYIITTTGTNLYSPQLSINDLSAGNYITTVVDSHGSTASATTTINSNTQQLIITRPATSVLKRQCSSVNYKIPVIINNIGNAYIEYEIDYSNNWVPLSPITTTTTNQLVYLSDIPNTANIVNGSISNSITIRYSNTSGGPCYSNSITIPKNLIELPTSDLTGNRIGANTNGVNNWLVTAFGGIGTIDVYDGHLVSEQSTGNQLGHIYNYNNGTTTITNGEPKSIQDSVGCAVNLQP